MSGSQTQTALDLAVLLVMQMGQDGRGWVLYVGHARPLSLVPNHTKAFTARLSVPGFRYPASGTPFAGTDGWVYLIFVAVSCGKI